MRTQELRRQTLIPRTEDPPAPSPPDTPVAHRCVIYEKFYYPKWSTHHLREEAYFYITMVQY